MHRRTIIVVGQREWAHRLYSILRETDRFTDLRLVESNIAGALRWIVAIPTASIVIRVGYRPAGRSWRAIAVDLLSNATCAWPKSKATILYYWIGTDVLDALVGHSEKRPRRRNGLYRKCNRVDVCGAPWLADELRRIGIHADPLFFPVDLPKFEDVPPLPAQFTVMSYVPASRAEFYGLGILLDSAASLPYIEFRIVGVGSEPWPGLPSNVTLMERCRDMSPEFLRCTVVARIAEHDSASSMVQEGLSYGRHVIFNYPFPHTNYLAERSASGLVGALRRLYSLHKSGKLLPNLDGYEYARTSLRSEPRNAWIDYLRSLSPESVKDEG